MTDQPLYRGQVRLSPPITSTTQSRRLTPTRLTSLRVSFSLLHFFLLLLCLLALLDHIPSAHGAPPTSSSAPKFLNISIPVTGPQIVYTPFLCTAAQAAASPDVCKGSWQAAAPNNPASSSSTTAFVSVALNGGPTTGSTNLIPQLFFQFQASALYLQTIAPSNATATISISPNSTSTTAISAKFDSALGRAAILNIPDDVTSLFTITITPQDEPTVFVLQGITLTARANVSLSSLFPSATLPPSASLPTLTPPVSASSTTTSSALPSETGSAGSNTRKKVAEAVGITIGLGLGLTALAVLGFCFWTRRRQRRKWRSNGAGRAAAGGASVGGSPATEGAQQQQSEWRTDAPARHRPRWPA